MRGHNAFKLLTFAVAMILAVFFSGANAESAKKRGPAYSADELEPSIDSGAVIAIESYDADADIYEVIITDEPDIGPNRAPTEDLAVAIRTLNLKALKKRPTSIVGNQYKLDRSLRLLNDLGVDNRKAKRAKARK